LLYEFSLWQRPHEGTRAAAWVEKWRDEKGIPVWVSLVDGDNKLTLNLKNILCIKTLISLVKIRPFFILSEYYLNEKNGVVYDQNGTYATEFIFAFKKTANQ
jgi:hypothetical protein